MTPVLTCLVGRLEVVGGHRLQLAETMRALRLSLADVADYAHFSHTSYTRNLVRRTDDLEIVVNCWKPGRSRWCVPTCCTS